MKTIPMLKKQQTRASLFDSINMTIVGISIFLGGAATLLGGMNLVAILVESEAVQDGNWLIRQSPVVAIGVTVVSGLWLLALGAVTLCGLGPVAAKYRPSTEDKHA